MGKLVKFSLKIIGTLAFILVVFLGWKFFQIGKSIDKFNSVDVYENGNFGNVSGRNVTDDGYNLGLKYQCVEFVKRYYFEVYQHKMPNSYGNALDFFQKGLTSGKLNKDRDLIQFQNGGKSKPKIGDLIVFDGTEGNPYGHVAIISKVDDNSIEIIQQNSITSRKTLQLSIENKCWIVSNSTALGWLRKN